MIWRMFFLPSHVPMYPIRGKSGITRLSSDLFVHHCCFQMLTLQGPWSERDAQMTETFARLQDIYGAGRVLGILGERWTSYFISIF